MRSVMRFLLLAVFVTMAVAQSPEPPISDTRLTVHTLVREDIFAGFLVNDIDRLSRGEKNIELLLEKRPDSKAELLAWKAGATLYRAVTDYENKRQDEFQKKYKQALELFNQARELNPRSGGVIATTGGSYVLFSDRLPEQYRAEAWSVAWDNFQKLWQEQGASIERMPVHFKGEVLAGLAMSAQRTGRKAETDKYLDKILEVLSGTSYEKVAKQWKSKPESAASSTLACMTCHESGRLSSRLTALNKN